MARDDLQGRLVAREEPPGPARLEHEDAEQLAAGLERQHELALRIGQPGQWDLAVEPPGVPGARELVADDALEHPLAREVRAAHRHPLERGGADQALADRHFGPDP